MRERSHVRALPVLLEACESWGSDCIVRSPLNILQTKGGMSYQAAQKSLAELERRGVLKIVKLDGNRIDHVRILKKVLEETKHPRGTCKGRLITAIAKYARNGNGSGRFLDCSFFSEVHSSADIVFVHFFKLLGELEDDGLIVRAYIPGKIDTLSGVFLTDKFPVQ